MAARQATSAPAMNRMGNDPVTGAPLLLGDNLSTGHFAAELAGVQPGGTYAVIGCGTVGLLASAAKSAPLQHLASGPAQCIGIERRRTHADGVEPAYVISVQQPRHQMLRARRMSTPVI